MLFSSITFLFYFLPALLLVWFPVRHKTQAANLVLLVASLFFYAWGEPVFILIMLASILANYVFGRLIVASIGKASFYLFLGLLFNLSLLFYFKYIGFFMANIANIFNVELTVPEVSLPLGISFFTFQAITYLVDLRRGEIPVQKNFFNLALYISLFPQLIAGPIVRYHDVEKQITSRRITLTGFASGTRRFIIGLGKKMLIANPFGEVADGVYAMPADDLTAYLVLIGMVAYTIQIYFDFSAYSDMAIGLGRMFGFHFLENFNYPYIATSIRDFWRRWHISLSTFLRDYLYIPLGGSRGGKTYRNLLVVFVLCGLWHGAEWTFVIWGLYFGFFLILERLFLGRVLQRLPKVFSWGYAIVIVIFSWLIFRAENMTQVFDMLEALFSGHTSPYHMVYTKDVYLKVAIVLAVVGATPLIRDYFLTSRYKAVLVVRDIFLVAVFILSVSFLAAGTYNPFIYFRF